MSGEQDRLPRLLALVPYLQARPGIPVEEAAADFGISDEQLRKDLQLLWLCGLPGHSPGDLIDLNFEGDTVSVIFDAGMSRPLRLTAEEALALVVALRTLLETPGIADDDAIQRALAKVEAAAGGGVDGSTVTVSLDEEERALPALQRAVDERRALRLRYYTPARDEVSDRVVDPVRLVRADGRAYLEAWCRMVEGMRLFRADRIEAVEVLDEPSRPPAEIELRDLSEGVYAPAADHLLVELRLGAAYAWVADYYTMEDVTDEPDGVLRVRLRVADPGWVRALVLGAAGAVTVLAPGWLADSIRAEAEAALAAYAAG
ncbi:MAG: helix-turn-helix transcriptional regulator [Jatrophihabitans sp.]|uniref:helix-turn-helix transcriptional regulator n=1 Tax=Jatrophihabitans sp. TaxID=1932789 RepID=UPI003F7FEB43